MLVFILSFLKAHKLKTNQAELVTFEYFFLKALLKDTLKAFNDFKKKQKNVRSYFF